MSPAALGGASHTRATSVNGGATIVLNKTTEGSKGGSRIFPHLDDLVNVRPDVDKHAPIKTIILTGEKLAKQADTHLDFRRPDIALEEYIKASIIAVEIIPRHKDYPATQGGELYTLYQGLKKRISKQDPKFFDVRLMIKEDNAKSGVKPLKTRSLGENDAGIRRNGPLNGHSRTQSEMTPSVSGAANYLRGSESDAESDNAHSRQKPAIQPKPQALHGKAIPSPTQTDLAARFARLRSPESKAPVQDPRIRTQPITLPEIPNSSPKSRSSLSSSTAGTSTSSRPSGPREMPMIPNGHVTQPRISVDVKIPNMPRAPDAIYSPARSTDSAATASLPSSVARGTSYTGHSRKSSAPPISSVGPTPSPVEPKQDYFVLSHSVNGHGAAQTPRPQDVFIPDSVYISAEDLFKFQRMGSQSVRVLHVDLRSRYQFDAGHIMSQSIICIEPIALRRGISGEEIADSMIVAPDAELALFKRRETFDLVVFYDQSSTKVNPFNNSGNEMDNCLHNFASAVYDFGYEKRVKRRPMLLVGGLDAWVDLMGSNSLKTSSNGTLGPGKSFKPSQRTAGTLSRVGAVRDPTRSLISRTRVESRVLTREEQNKWNETLNEDRVSGRPADADPDASDELFYNYAKTTDDFFRRFPDISTIQESMVSNNQSPRPLHSYGDELSNSIPQPPTRPAPALPRQRSSGLSERGPKAVYAAGHDANLSNNAITAPRVEPGLTGLYNPHNLCYLNSSLQAISATPMIRDEVLRHRSGFSTIGIPKKDDESASPSQLFLKNLGVVMTYLWNGQYDWISPKTFAAYVNAIHKTDDSSPDGRFDAFGGSRTQHDAAEFLTFMLQIIADETNDKRNVKEEPLTDAELDARDDRESSLSDLDAAQVAMARLRTHMNSFVVLNMFPQMMYRLECKKPSCKFVTRRISHQPELSLTVSQDTPMSESLENLIRHDYGPQSRETVDSTCAKCKREGRGEDGHRLLERKLCYLPEYLVVTLMRYHADPSTGHIRKHLNRITFPESGIDMSEYFIDAKGSKSALLGHRPNPIYDCYAVLEHIGERARAGHYYTFARSLDKAAKNGNGPGAWHLYNDRSVTKREFADIEAHNVAVIFLKRRPINR